jgi:hypothetical protein
MLYSIISSLTLVGSAYFMAKQLDRREVILGSPTLPQIKVDELVFRVFDNSIDIQVRKLVEHMPLRKHYKGINCDSETKINR